MSELSSSKATTVVMGSGGHRGIAMLGILHYLDTHGYLESVTKWVGVSVGAMISYLTIMGYNAQQIMQITQSGVTESDFRRMSTLNLVSNFYLTAPTDLRKSLVLYTGLAYPGRGEMTLQEMFELTGHHFVAVAYDTVSKTIKYLDHETVPNMTAVDAVIASASLPVIYPPVIYTPDNAESMVLVDGAMGGEYPIDVYDDGQTPTIGIWATYKNSSTIVPETSDETDDETSVVSEHPYTALFNSRVSPARLQLFVSYVLSLIGAPMSALDRIRQERISDQIQSFVVPVDIPVMYTKLLNGETSLVNDTSIQLFMDGFNFAKHKLVREA